MTRAEAIELKEKLKAGEAVLKAGGIQTKKVESKRLGYDRYETYVNNILVKYEYVKSKDLEPNGTEEAPFIYEEGMELLNNNFYLKDEKLYVWMDKWVEW